MPARKRSAVDPKKKHGDKKPPLALIPPAAEEECAKALALGAFKYGMRNWMRSQVNIMTYLHAMKRHINCVLEGEDIDPESGGHHLGAVMAGCSIVLDARKHGMLVDDRVLPPQRPCRPMSAKILPGFGSKRKKRRAVKS
jgi:hypothetical protein